MGQETVKSEFVKKGRFCFQGLQARRLSKTSRGKFVRLGYPSGQGATVWFSRP